MIPPLRTSSAPNLAQRLAERKRPDRPAVMVQRWEHLAFLHWRFDSTVVQATLPAGLTVDTFAGEAWVGLVPIFMRNVRPHFVPPIPYVSSFLELNLRTYVFDPGGRPGVYFYSLACDQPLVVAGARRLLGLNYEHSEMKGDVIDGRVTLSSLRAGQALADTFVYRSGDDPAIEAAGESLEFFLIERYRLFAEREGELSSIQVHHAPYRLRPLVVPVWGEQAFALAGLPAPHRVPEHICTSDTVDLEVFLPQPVGSPASGDQSAPAAPLASRFTHG
jgi:uncharacterized protein YqjF (DUF2071 family)